MMKPHHFSALLVVLALGYLTTARAADRPNFVWMVSEDNSIRYLDHFFPGGAKTPHIEAMAAQGLTFDQAFSSAPVCSGRRPSTRRFRCTATSSL